MIKNQKGLTAISWMLIIGFIATQGIVAIRIIPTYVTFNSVKDIMNGLVGDSEVIGKNPKHIKKIINRRLSVNSIYTFKDKPKAFTVRRVDGGAEVSVHYEERGPIVANLDYVTTFDYSVKIPNK